MSLVNEALKKAHLEATRQRTEAAALVAPRPAPKLYVPEIRKPNTGYVLALIAAVFVVVLSGTVARVTSRPGTTVISRKPTPLPAPSIQSDASASQPVIPMAVELHATNEPTAEAAEDSPVPPFDDRRSAEAADSSTNPPALPPSDLVDGKVYIQSVSLSATSKFLLNGILWSDKPLAILNNITLGPGEELEGVTVLAIEPKRVKLRAQGREFFVRLP